MNTVQIPRRFVRHEWGGTETVVLETCKRLPDFGVQTEIFTPNALADGDDETIDGVKVRRFDYFYPYLGLSDDARVKMDKKGGNLFSLPLMRALMAYPDLGLIHLHTMKRLGGIGRWVARRRGVPYIVSLHGGAFDVPDAEAATWTEPTRGALEWGKVLGAWVGSNRVLDDAAAVVCVGENEWRATRKRYPNQRVECLPNGVDAARFAHGNGVRFRARHGLPGSALVLLTVARIDPQKNQLLAVQALPALLAQEPAAHLVFIGPATSASYRDDVLTAARRLGVADRVTLIPGLDAGGQELVDAYHAADLFLLPSRHEPFGIALIEAWAAGCPVIASAVGGVPFLVRDGDDGLLFPPDDATGLVRAVAAWRALSTDARAAMVARARTRAHSEFDWAQITARLASLYDSVVSGAPEPADRRRPAESV